MDRENGTMSVEPLVVLRQVAEIHDGITALFEALVGQMDERDDARARQAGLVASVSEAAHSLNVANSRIREVEKIIRDVVRRVGE